jgi:hypothetical protein
MVDESRAARYWWIGPLLACAFLVGLAGSSLAGYYVRDPAPTNPAYNNPPQCPPGMVVVEPWGVVLIGNTWQPIYRCEPYTGQRATEYPVTTQPRVTTATVTPT